MGLSECDEIVVIKSQFLSIDSGHGQRHEMLRDETDMEFLDIRGFEVEPLVVGERAPTSSHVCLTILGACRKGLCTVVAVS